MRDKEEKLLFMGASIGTEEAVSYAREQGVYTILTAQNAPENGEEKFGADEYWNIDLADLVSLEKKCRKESCVNVLGSPFMPRMQAGQLHGTKDFLNNAVKSAD